MHRALRIGFVIALTSVVVASARHVDEEQFEPVVDADAYAVYAAVLPSMWTPHSKDPLLLQQETEPFKPDRSGCLERLVAEPGWATVVTDFLKANSLGPKVLQPMLPLRDVYLFVSRAVRNSSRARHARAATCDHDRRARNSPRVSDHRDRCTERAPGTGTPDEIVPPRRFRNGPRSV